MLPESPKGLSDQLNRETSENLSKVRSSVDIKPGKVLYLRESSDKKYYIYRYIVATGGTKGGIKNKYVDQIGDWVDGTHFTDADGKELMKDKFNAGEAVYLKVPKNNEVKNQKEKKNTPGKFVEINKKTDSVGRKWKIYSYTLLHGGDDKAIESKFQQQYSMYYQYLLPGKNFCDKNGNVIDKRKFNKGETVYIKIPNRDIVDSVPTITNSDIKKLSDDKIKKIYNSFKRFEGSDEHPNRGSLYEHSDHNGRYILINLGSEKSPVYKKIYFFTHKKYYNKQPCCVVDINEGIIDFLAMGQYDGKNFDCVYCDFRGVRRGTNILKIK